MADTDPFEFVFGPTLDRSAWDDADVEERLHLLGGRLQPLGRPRALIRLGVVELLLSPDTGYVWATAQRLARSGLDVEEVIGQLSIAFAEAHTGKADDGTPFDERAYRRRLDRLPLPSADEIEQALLAVASEAVILSSDDLVSLTARRLGFPPDDRLAVHLVERVEEELSEELGPLAWLAGDRTAHVEALCQGIVLTHVLTDAERETGTLAASFDLAGFAWLDAPTFEDEWLEAISAERGHLAWMGPEDWLFRFDAGTTLAVRVDAVGVVDVQVLAEEPPLDRALVDAVRQVYEEEVAEPQLPVSGVELIIGVLARDRHAFDRPQAPLTALCQAAGLEKHGSEVAHDVEIWRNCGLAARYAPVFRQAGDDKELSEAVLTVLAVCDDLRFGESVGDGTIRRALDALADPDVLALTQDELLEPPGGPLAPVELPVTAFVVAADRARRRAVARLLAALDAERAGDWAAAEQHLELAVEADPSFVPTTDRLAWYAGDRGDAARAVQLWRRCPRSPRTAQDLATVEPFATTTPALGRNERCWCGSGRKYKQCHLGVPGLAPLPDRVGWLCAKAVGYLERAGPEGRAAVLDMVWSRVGDDGDWAEGLADPLVMDLVLTEGGWFARFLEDRGRLLPDDEAMLASSWLTIDRSVHEVVSVAPGAGLVLHDLRTGDTVDVRERTFSHQARVGSLICARPVPDGETHQLVGAVFPVAVGHEGALLDLLDGGDPDEIAAWVHALEAPPKLHTREGEPLVDCTVVLTASDPDALVAHLNATYSVDVPGEAWTEHHDLDDVEAVIRATLRLDGDRLTITTNSEERADRILDRLADAVAVTVSSDERHPVDLASIRPPAPGRRQRPESGVDEHDQGVPEEVVAEIQAQMEQRWCDEPVPALGGLTPRQAAADPTRREQLERLLASFDTMPLPPGAFGLRTDRLRARLEM